jgi:hypothetical protein
VAIPAYPALSPLVVWHRTVLVYAVLLALEGALLVLVTQLRRRPVFEQLLALAPVAAFLWVAFIARDMRATYLDWYTFVTWVTAHYPPAFVQHAYDGLDEAVAGVQRTGWIVFVLTLSMGELGWALVLQCFVAPPAAPQANALPTEDDGLEITVTSIE